MKVSIPLLVKSSLYSWLDIRQIYVTAAAISTENLCTARNELCTALFCLYTAWIAASLYKHQQAFFHTRMKLPFETGRDKGHTPEC